MGLCVAVVARLIAVFLRAGRSKLQGGGLLSLQPPAPAACKG